MAAINSVHCVNSLHALPSILRYYLLCKDRLALKIFDLAKEMRNREVVTAGHFSAVTRHKAPPRNFAPIILLANN